MIITSSQQIYSKTMGKLVTFIGIELREAGKHNCLEVIRSIMECLLYSSKLAGEWTDFLGMEFRSGGKHQQQDVVGVRIVQLFTKTATNQSDKDWTEKAYTVEEIRVTM